MSWIVRFLAWISLLVPPCFLLIQPYQAWLARATVAILGACRIFIAPPELRLYEPVNLGVYAAMCLASSRTPRSARLRAAGIGVSLLIGLTLGIIVLIIGAMEVARREGRSPDDAVARLLVSAIETVPWVSGPALWLVLLGPSELADSGLVRRVGPGRRTRKH